MRFYQVVLLGALALGSPLANPSFTEVLSLPSARAVPEIAGHHRNASLRLSKRGEPSTGADLPDSRPHPNRLNQVETAFKDVLELTSDVLDFIDTDNSILPHYFSVADRAEIKRHFSVINNNGKGAAYLDHVFVQVTDRDHHCNDLTLAYSGDYNTDKPFIVLCPNAFKKKAINLLEGKPTSASDAHKYYAECARDGGEIADHVSYKMNTLGVTLLHEYMHLERMFNSPFGAIIDDPSKNPGYGPVNVYDKLPKNLARINADSYAYYAAQVLWTKRCRTSEFKAPRPGIDDNDPDCGKKACHS